MKHPSAMTHNDWAQVIRQVVAPWLYDEGKWPVWFDTACYYMASVLAAYYRKGSNDKA